MVRKAFLLAAVLMAAALAAAPALAQTDGGQYREVPSEGWAGAIARGPGDPPVPDLPDYVLSEDGTVIIDGDTGESCRTFASSIPTGEDFPTSVADAPPDFPLADPSPDFEQARSVLEQCERRGLLPSGYRAELPATGGLGPSVPGTPLASGALLIALTVLGIAVPRRTP